mmetsp:Transcript_21383/g.40198  ORF Transcript_21383/g.40198 Transcript_21383/m.40198 type:complete len:257 (-) Transcript_21383:2725-3495(-)
MPERRSESGTSRIEASALSSKSLLLRNFWLIVSLILDLVLDIIRAQLTPLNLAAFVKTSSLLSALIVAVAELLPPYAVDILVSFDFLFDSFSIATFEPCFCTGAPPPPPPPSFFAASLSFCICFSFAAVELAPIRVDMAMETLAPFALEPFPFFPFMLGCLRATVARPPRPSLAFLSATFSADETSSIFFSFSSPPLSTILSIFLSFAAFSACFCANLAIVFWRILSSFLLTILPAAMVENPILPFFKAFIMLETP